MRQKKILGAYSLIFKEKGLEEKYKESWKNYKIITFKFISIFNTIIPSATIMLLDLLPVSLLHKTLLTFLQIIAFAWFYYIFANKFRNHLDFALIIFSTAMVIVPVESFTIQHFQGNMRYYCLGLYVQMVICLLLLFRTPFHYNFPFIIVLQIYAAVRVNRFGNGEERDDAMVVPLVHIIILLGEYRKHYYTYH